MSNYGVQPTGFVRKPLSVILSEVEASLITEFGPGVIQTSQSPLGQLNGLMADLITELWEVAEDVYQSYDPTQAEGTRLDILGSVRLVKRGGGESDEVYRQAITNDDTARITYADFIRALKSISGVTYAQVFANETGLNNSYNMPPNTVTAAVLGGDEDEIADVVNDYVAPGISMFGNTVTNIDIDGYCRAIKFVRPVEIEISMRVFVKMDATNKGCPAPSPSAVASALLSYLTDIETRPWNGQSISPYLIRQFIESKFSGVQFFSFLAIRGDDPTATEQSNLDFPFFEIAKVVSVSVEEIA